MTYDVDAVPAWARDLQQSLPPTLTVDQAAGVLHKTPRSVRSYIAAGDLEAVRLGGNRRGVLVPRDSLIRFLEAAQ